MINLCIQNIIPLLTTCCPQDRGMSKKRRPYNRGGAGAWLLTQDHYQETLRQRSVLPIPVPSTHEAKQTEMLGLGTEKVYFRANKGDQEVV